MLRAGKGSNQRPVGLTETRAAAFHLCELNWYLKAFLAPFAVPPSIQLSSGASVFTARAVRLSYLEQMH